LLKLKQEATAKPPTPSYDVIGDEQAKTKQLSSQVSTYEARK